ncbi:MAG: PAS domain-containing protein [Rhodospirillaceae bacterium]|nr:PAS domain-containing protein [Rhodospirillaceae bacterium]
MPEAPRTSKSTTQTPRKPLLKRPGLWLIVALIAAAPLAAIQWHHPLAIPMAAGAGGIALLCLALALWTAIGGNANAGAGSLAELALDADTEGLALTDRAGSFIYANPAFHKLLSFAAAETPSRRVESLDAVAKPLIDADSDGAEDVRRLIAHGLEGGAGVAEFAVPGRRLGFGAGQAGIAWRRLQVTSLDASPKSGQRVWRVADITDRREIEEIRIDEQKKSTDLLDFLPVGVFSADGEGIIRYANQTLARWLGKPPEHLIGTPFADYVADVGDDGEVIMTDGEGRTFTAGLEQSQKDTIEGEIAYTRSIVIRNQIWNDPTAPHIPCAPRTPERVPEQSAEAAPLPAASGLPGTPPDANLPAASLAGLHGLFDEAPVGMVLLDLEGTIQDANRAFLKMLGKHRDALMGQPFADSLAREDRGDLSGALSKIVMGTARAAHMEVRLPGTGAREFNLSLYASRFTDAEGEVSGIVLHLIDNTEQKNLEVQFAQSQKMQAVGQLAGGVAHDFNNLLTAMIGFCDLLLERHGPDDPSFADLQQIRQNANRATNLVRQLLAFSRKQTLEPVRLDVTDGLADLASLLRRLIGETVELDMQHGRDLLPVKGDKSQFDQIIINLCVNARDAMPGGGAITVSTQNVTLTDPVQRGHDLMPPGRYVLVDVADTGTGISKEHMERIFEPFFSTKEAGAGTGLGLSTVYGIVHQSGGFIFVDSAPGEGTTFSIYLPEFEEPGGQQQSETVTQGQNAPAAAPRSAEAPASQAAASEPSPEPPADPDLTGSATVLLVEDEDAVRMFAKRALENKGYTVLEAANGEIALDVVSSTDASIDIIVSDVIMPGMDGHTLVGLVRQELPGVKVILMSGYAEDMYHDEIGRDATLHFLGKPFTLKDLAAKVKDVLAG